MNPLVMVGIPSGTMWHADFGLCLAGLVASAPRPLKGGGRLEALQLWNTKGSILSRSRDTLVKQAMKAKMTHLLMIDTDMTFPQWTLHQLLSHKKMVVAANCATKGSPSYPTARQKSEKPAGELVLPKKDGLEQVWRVGTGVMLIDLKVFDTLPQPWFPITWNEAIDDYTGEDWNFCAALEQAGIPVYIDHKLSAQIGHIGSYTYSLDDTGRRLT